MIVLVYVFIFIDVFKVICSAGVGRIKNKTLIFDSLILVKFVGRCFSVVKSENRESRAVNVFKDALNANCSFSK